MDKYTIYRERCREATNPAALGTELPQTELANCHGLRRRNARSAADSNNPLSRTNLLRHPANTNEDVQKLLIGYRDNMRVEIEQDIPVSAKTVADLRALSTWPGGLVLSIHVDLDPRLSVVRVERTS